MTPEKKLVTTSIVLGVILLVLVLCGTTDAGPPHPSRHYKWQAMPNGTVVLYFLEEGQYSRYVYKLTKPTEPATQCNHSYGTDTFRMITYDTSHPYWYTIEMKPFMKWHPVEKKYITLND